MKTRWRIFDGREPEVTEMSKTTPHPKFMEAMRKLKAMPEEERLSEANKALFEQAIKYAPLDIQPALIAIEKKYAETCH